MNSLAPQDLALLLKSQRAILEAQQLSAFVSSHLTEVYKLGAQDQIDIATGEITRSQEVSE